MFHKHDDRLQQLNDELLAEDEEYYEEEYDEAEDLSEEALAELLGEEPEEEPLLCRNHANGYGASVRNYANQYGKGSPKEFNMDYFDEEDDLEDEEFLYRDDYRHAKKQKKSGKKQAEKKKNDGIVWAILALLELIAIGGIIAWWVSWLR